MKINRHGKTFPTKCLLNQHWEFLGRAIKAITNFQVWKFQIRYQYSQHKLLQNYGTLVKFPHKTDYQNRFHKQVSNEMWQNTWEKEKKGRSYYIIQKTGKSKKQFCLQKKRFSCHYHVEAWAYEWADSDWQTSRWHM